MIMQTLTTETGRYTFLEDRDMAKDLAKAKRRHSINIKNAARFAPAHVLAKRAAGMYQARMDASTAGEVTVHVFKVTGSENTLAAQFRLWLSAYLTGHVRTGRYFGDTVDACGYSRATLEAWAEKAGYNFVEVDPTEWGFK